MKRKGEVTMLNKKLISTGLAFILILVLVGCSRTTPSSKPGSNGSGNQVINDNDLSIIINEENMNEIDLTETNKPQSPLDKLTFPEDVAIKSIEKLNNQYLAYGSKNEKPYLQSFTVVNNELKTMNAQELATSGEVTNITEASYYLSATNSDDSKFDFIMTDAGIVPLQIKQINYNYSKNVTMIPKYLVIHETNNIGVGANANAHYRYWNRDSGANASTHFVVDNKEIYQMLKLNQVAWHVGDNRGHSSITNMNSIGIEIAVNQDGNYEVARQNTIQLTINVMKSLNMDITQLKRHYDASGKLCPLKMIETPSLWTDFVNQVEAGLNA
jgi:hypothetical protein